jgi:hypothetical protein
MDPHDRYRELVNQRGSVPINLGFGGATRCNGCNKLAYLVNRDNDRITLRDFNQVFAHPQQGFSYNTSRVPQRFKCPLSGDILRNPVRASDGNAYELAMLRHWFATTMKHKGRFQSPDCKQLFNHVYPDFDLKEEIAQHVQHALGMTLVAAHDRHDQHAPVDPGVLSHFYAQICHMLHPMQSQHSPSHAPCQVANNQTVCIRKSTGSIERPNGYTWGG